MSRYLDKGGLTYLWRKVLAKFKVIQTPVTAPSTTAGTATTFVDSISQDAQGVISYTKKTIVDEKVKQDLGTGDTYYPIISSPTANKTSGSETSTVLYHPALMVNPSKMSVAEGSGTTASANYSHAGGLGTVANQEAMTAIGKYNVSGDTTGQLFAVGNGTSTSNRSNAFSVNSNGLVTVQTGIMKSSDPSETKVWNTSGGTVDLESYPYICSDTITDTPDGFVYRQTNNGIEKNKENATITHYVGNSLVWNQLVLNPNIVDTTNIISQGTITASDNELNITPLASGNYTSTRFKGITWVGGHKYYASVYVKYSETGQTVVNLCVPSYDRGFGYAPSTTTNWQKLSAITTALSTDGYSDTAIMFYNSTENPKPYKLKNVVCFDLTLMFGAGKEPSTVAEFEKLLTEPYYPYNAGTLINNRTKAIESVGFNLWDEEWELGNIDDNGEYVSGSNVRSKNYIQVFGNNTYRYQGGNAVIYCYDSAKNLIPYTGTSAYHNGIDVTDRTFDLPNNTAYIRFRTSSSYGTVYNHDICINLSDTSRNGTYEPYKKYDLPINLNSFRVKDSNGNIITIEGGLKSAGSVYDEITSDGKYIKRIGSVDLGTLSWGYYNFSGTYAFYAIVADAAYISQGFKSPSLQAKYYQVYETYAATNLINKQLSTNTNQNYVYVRDDSYTDAASFKTAMSGVQLYYELATPEVYDLVEVIPNNYPVDDLGTEARIAPLIDGVPGSPFKGDIDYYRSSDSYLHTVTVNGFPAHVNNGTAEIELPLEQLSGHIYDKSKDSLAEGVIEGKGDINTASGVRSHAEGVGTVASGKASHAEGRETTASAEDAHAEGLGTQATKKAAHAEGNATVASASYAHAEGRETEAAAESAHAEGYKTDATGKYSHAEGLESNANGKGSHAEGNKTHTDANADFAHAEGNDTYAAGKYSHAEGTETQSNGQASHAEGDRTYSSGDAAHAEGSRTYAYSKYGHAEGQQTQVYGDADAAHAEGYTTQAHGKYSHAEGNNSYSIGDDSHAEGFHSSSVGLASHSEGYYSSANGDNSHSEGFRTGAYGVSSHAEGNYSETRGEASHAEGNRTEVRATYGHTEGDSVVATGYASHAENIGSRTNVTLSGYFRGKCAQSYFYSDLFFYISEINNLIHSDFTNNEDFYRHFDLDFAGATFIFPPSGDSSGQIKYKPAYNYLSQTEATIVGYEHSDNENDVVSFFNVKILDENNNVIYIQDALEEYNGQTPVSINLNIHPINAGGSGSHSEGKDTQSLGDYSHAEGWNTKTGKETGNEAIGAHAEGINTISDSQASHAEGISTVAGGSGAHAEGYSTTASGQASHAEGASTYAKADGSHAEGILTTAGRLLTEVAAAAQQLGITGTQVELVTKLAGYGAHVEGTNNNALGSASHAEGNATNALANATHAEGDTTTAFGEASHAEGYNTQAKGNQSHAEGQSTIANGNSSHVEGIGSTASGNYSHAEGSHTESEERDSHAEGAYSKASGIASHAEGDHTIASGNNAHAGGLYTIADQDAMTAIGKYNKSGITGAIFNLGIGTSENARKNAHLITTDGKHYIPGIGGYDGTQTSLTGIQDVASVFGNYLPLAGGTMTGTINSQNVLPKSNLAYTLGDATHRWNNIYGNHLIIGENSTISGSNNKNTAIVGENSKTIEVYNSLIAGDKNYIINGAGNMIFGRDNYADGPRTHILGNASVAKSGANYLIGATNFFVGNAWHCIGSDNIGKNASFGFLLGQSNYINKSNNSTAIGLGSSYPDKRLYRIKAAGAPSVSGNTITFYSNITVDGDFTTDMASKIIKIGIYIDTYSQWAKYDYIVESCTITKTGDIITYNVTINSTDIEVLNAKGGRYTLQQAINSIPADGAAYGQILFKFSNNYIGTSTSSATSNIITIGSALTGIYSNQVITGRYNTPIDNAIFSVGLGTASDQQKNGLVIMNDGKHYIPGVGGYIGTETDLTNVKDLASVLTEGEPMESITYADLVTKKSNSQLIPGKQYRITDYTTTTVQSNTQSAGHVFDVIVVADSTNTLNENARAIQHVGDTYFTNYKLHAWQLKYCLDNDTSRFAWADSTNGKGVIYYMKDEFDNECPYDFKNIMYKVGEKTGPGTKANVFYYTFSVATGTNDATVKDHSLNGSKCYENKIELYIDINKQTLSFNVFRNTATSSNCYANTFGYNNHNNVFGNNCNSNKFGRGFIANTFGVGCASNTFGDDCDSVTFGNTCISNTFGNNCRSIIFGSSCFYNIFGEFSSSNTFGNSCSYNFFGNYCRYNNFGLTCSYNTFGNNCSSNTFGNICSSNTFGNGSSSNIFGECSSSNTFGDSCSYIRFGTSSSTKDYYSYIIVENGNQHIYLDCTATTSDSAYYQNVKIAQGVNNTSTWKTITDSNFNQNYQTVYQPANSQIISV